MDDDSIVALYWERSETALAATSEKYANYCWRVAFNILGSGRDAEECVNDTWLRAWGAIPPARPARLAAFLGKITRNLSINMLEKRQAGKRGHGQTEAALSELEECLAYSAPDAGEIMETEELSRALDRFLAGLTQSQRVVFTRRYWHVRGIDEIAGECAMSVSKVKSMLFRTRKKLREFLEKEGISI